MWRIPASVRVAFVTTVVAVDEWQAGAIVVVPARERARASAAFAAQFDGTVAPALTPSHAWPPRVSPWPARNSPRWHSY